MITGAVHFVPVDIKWSSYICTGAHWLEQFYYFYWYINEIAPVLYILIKTGDTAMQAPLFTPMTVQPFIVVEKITVHGYQTVAPSPVLT